MPEILKSSFEKPTTEVKTACYISLSEKEKRILANHSNFKNHSIENFVYYGLYVYDSFTQWQIEHKKDCLIRNEFVVFMQDKTPKNMTAANMELLFWLVFKFDQKIKYGERTRIIKCIESLFNDFGSKKNEFILDIFSDAMYVWQYNSPNLIDNTYKKYYNKFKQTIYDSVANVSWGSDFPQLHKFWKKNSACCLWAMALNQKDVNSLFIKPACQFVLEKLFWQFDQSDQKLIKKMLMDFFNIACVNSRIDFLVEMDPQLEKFVDIANRADF